MPNSFVVLPEDRLRGLNVVGEKITVLASSAQTRGYEIFFQDGVKDTGPPPHSHDWDESFYVLQGNIAFGVDDIEMIAPAGTLVHIAAGSVHWFRFESDEGQMLSITGNNSGASAFFTQVDSDVADGSDLATLGVVAQKHQLTVYPPKH